MSAERNHKDSSFAGFLNDYSRGNVAVTSHLNAIVSVELLKLIETIDEIMRILGPEANKLSEQLALAKEVLQVTEDSNVTKLLSFSRVLEISVVIYPAVYKGLDPDIKNTLSHLFTGLIVEFITIVKKMGNSALLETAIRLIQKVDKEMANLEK